MAAFSVALTPEERATAELIAQRKGLRSVGSLFRLLLANENERLLQANSRFGLEVPTNGRTQA